MSGEQGGEAWAHVGERNQVSCCLLRMRVGICLSSRNLQRITYEEQWYFSIFDVVGALTEQTSARNASTHWAVLKKRLSDEGSNQLLTNCKQLRMPAKDGKVRKTDVANTVQLLRIIQSIPSKKAEHQASSFGTGLCSKARNVVV